jgi:P-type E1-E2 ATPase
VRRSEALWPCADRAETFAYTPGRGIVARSNGEEILVGNRAFAEQHGIPAGSIATIEDARATSEVLVARDGRLLGTILMADVIRPEAPDAIRALHRLGITTLLLTGDAWPVASAVGFKLGVDDVRPSYFRTRQVKRCANTDGRLGWRWSATGSMMRRP